MTQGGVSPGGGGANNVSYTNQDKGCTIVEFDGQHVEFPSLATARATENQYLIHLGGTHYLDCALKARLGLCKASKVNTPPGLFHEGTGQPAEINVGLKVDLANKRAWLVVIQALASGTEHFFGYGNGFRIPNTEEASLVTEYVETDETA